MNSDCVAINQNLMNAVYDEPDVLPLLHELANVVGCGMSIELVQQKLTEFYCNFYQCYNCIFC